MKNWPTLEKWKKLWEKNFDKFMDRTSEEKNEDPNRWSNFNNIPSIDFIILASKYGVKDFFFFIDPFEIGKEFPVVDQLKLNEEVKQYFPNKNVHLRYTKGNSLIASTNDFETASAILNLKEAFQLKTKIKLATGNLFTSFVINDIEQDISICDFLKTLKIENEIPVISARRFYRQGKPTKSIQITIPGNALPKEVRIDRLIIKVERYNEKPTQCYSCYQFGHIKRKCRIAAKCSKCGTEIRKIIEEKEFLHDVENCKINKCGNCKGNHKTDDPLCIEYVKNVKLIEIRKNLQVPLFEAKRIYYNENKGSYASIVKSQQVQSSTEYEKIDILSKLNECQTTIKELKSKQEKELEDIRNILSQFITRNELNDIVWKINEKIENNTKIFNEQFLSIDQKLNRIIVSQEKNTTCQKEIVSSTQNENKRKNECHEELKFTDNEAESLINSWSEIEDELDRDYYKEKNGLNKEKDRERILVIMNKHNKIHDIWHAELKKKFKGRNSLIDKFLKEINTEFIL